jgi:hypothetical protein
MATSLTCFCFPLPQIGSPKKGRKYVIHASSSDELESWMEALRRVVRDGAPRAAVERPSSALLHGAYTHTRTRAG